MSRRTQSCRSYLNMAGNPNKKQEAKLRRKHVATADIDYPDGGFRAWLVVVGTFCVMFFTFGYLNAFGYFWPLSLASELAFYLTSIPSTDIGHSIAYTKHITHKTC